MPVYQAIIAWGDADQVRTGGYGFGKLNLYKTDLVILRYAQRIPFCPGVKHERLLSKRLNH
jgi:hypothetical protein